MKSFAHASTWPKFVFKYNILTDNTVKKKNLKRIIVKDGRNVNAQYIKTLE